MLLRSRPSMTLSFASSRSSMATTGLLRRAARSAASFTTLDSSAPDNPGVPLAMRSRFTLAPSGILRVWTRRICSRPFTSGMSTTIWRSNRPGRNSAGSRISGRFVAASRMTPSFDSKPSISTSSWFSVCSRSSCPPPSLARDRLGEQRLPRSRRTDQQRPLGEPPAQPLELLRVLEEIDDLLELLLRFVGAGHIGERDLGSVSREELGFRLAERERAVSPLLHLPHHENQQADDEEVRQEAEEKHAKGLFLFA